MSRDILFNSVFAEDIIEFIREKQAAGYKYHESSLLLKSFDDYVCSCSINTSNLNKEVVLGWAKFSTCESNATHQVRISIIRGLANYMIRMGKLSYVYPKGTKSIDRYSYTPYIFSEDEINAIFKASDSYSVSNTSPYRHLILPVLIRMLYCCGLRVSEATHLTAKDVDLVEGTLFIKNTKFGKERLIPMSNGLVKMCCDYSWQVQDRNKSAEYFFPSPYGGYYDISTVYKHFRKIIWRAGISHTGKGPRLQDFRHTFAVHCLKKWVMNGKDLTNCLPYLSAYLGHEDLRGTQHYLRLTSDLYPNIVRKVEKSCSWLIPEVDANETD